MPAPVEHQGLGQLLERERVLWLAERSVGTDVEGRCEQGVRRVGRTARLLALVESGVPDADMELQELLQRLKQQRGQQHQQLPQVLALVELAVELLGRALTPDR